jgi:hypothetical protein
MNVCDDGPYIRMAQTFANTGHIVYNGWGAAMMAAQLFLGAVFVKFFGPSTTSVRMSTLLLAAVSAFVLHHTLVRTGSSERNATLGTLAVVLSPLYLMLSFTFMNDIAGFFTMTLCLYGCVRAIQASSDSSAIGWICFAVFTCAVFGTSRQIAWLGDLIMVPSALWLLRSRSRVLLAGIVATALALLFILGCTRWLGHQPYAVAVPLIVRPFPHIPLKLVSYIVLEIPFLLLPVVAAFIPCIFRSRPYTRPLLLAALVAYLLIAYFARGAANPILRLEPTAGNLGMVNVYGLYEGGVTDPHPIVGPVTLIVLTAVCIGGLLGVIAVALRAHGAKSSPQTAADALSWKQLGFLLLPFSIAYLIFLVVAAATVHDIFDRYAIGLLGPTMIVLVRLYQEQVQPNLPLATVLLIIIMAVYGISITHNTFALDRARVDLANELYSNGVPFTSIDGGWDYNLDTELRYSDHINDPRIRVPANTYIIPPPAPPGYCEGFWHDRTPHVQAIYGVSFDPNHCYGRAPFAAVQYRSWPFGTPVNLYAVRYAPPGQ